MLAKIEFAARPLDKRRALLRPLIQHCYQLPIEDFASRPVGQDLALGVAKILGEAVIPLCLGSIERLYEVETAATAHEWALRNFRRSHERTFKMERRGQLYISNRSDGFDAERILLLPAWMKARGWSSLVASVPSRDLLLVANLEKPTGLVQMLEEVTRLRASGAPLLSARPMVLRRDGMWHPFTSPAMFARAFDSLHWELMVKWHAARRSARADAFKARAEQWTVAALEMMQIGGRRLAVCSWTREPALLIPQAQFISFCDGASGTRYGISWETAQAHLSHYLKLTEWRPELYMVSGFPTVGELCRIGARVLV